jgi:hypothetical protein
MIGDADNTRDLFSWQPPQVAVGYAEEVAGKGPLQNRIARLVSRALRDARDDRGLGRGEIARRMTDELGRKVSEDVLDKWSSEAAEAHRIPLDAFIALIAATGANELLGFVPGLLGFVVVPKKYKAFIDLQLLEDHERDVAAHKAKILADMRGQQR